MFHSLRQRLLGTFCLGLTAALLGAGCSASADPESLDPEARTADEVGQVGQPLLSGATTGDTSGTIGGSGTVAERPRCDKLCQHNACMSDCGKTHLNRTWCTAYCDCRVLYGGGTSECANNASDRFIDL